MRYPGLQRETPVWAILAQGCPGLGTLGPVCVVFEVTAVLKELSISSVFGGKKEGGAKETACHTRSASVTVAEGGEEGQSLSSVFEAKLFPLRKREGNHWLVPWGWPCYSFTCRRSVDSLSQCLRYLLSTDCVPTQVLLLQNTRSRVAKGMTKWLRTSGISGQSQATSSDRTR